VDRLCVARDEAKQRLVSFTNLTVLTTLTVGMVRVVTHNPASHKRSFSGDALLTPTTVTAAVPIASIDQNTAPAVFTRWVNFYDLCAAAVPNGFTAGGLPTSLQIVCRGYEEALALRIGWAYQTAYDWHMRVPALAL
jgi:aspartyl-tRNA(Asn)/glutamyl-tRNA(Gln) amidotransferase subunit A